MTVLAETSKCVGHGRRSFDLVSAPKEVRVKRERVSIDGMLFLFEHEFEW